MPHDICGRLYAVGTPILVLTEHKKKSHFLLRYRRIYRRCDNGDHFKEGSGIRPSSLSISR